MQNLSPTNSARAPDIGLPIGRAIGHSVFGQIFYLGSQLAVLVALTQLRGTAAVGEFGLALALSTPFFMIVNMGGRASQSSDVGRLHGFDAYGGMVGVFTLLGVAGSIGVGYLFAHTTHTMLIIAVVALMKAFESISNLSYGAFMQAARPDKITFSLILRGAIALPLFVALLLLGAPVAVAFMAQLVTWAAIALLIDYPAASKMAEGKLVLPSTDGPRVWKLVREVAPLGGSFGLGALLNSMPRLVVEHFLGLHSVGILTIIAYFQQAGSIIISAISQPLINRFAHLRHSDCPSDLRKLQLVLLGLTAGASIVGILFVAVAGKWTLGFLFGPDLADASYLLMLIALSLAAKLIGIVPQSLMHAARQYWAFLYREFLSVLICFGLLIWLVPTTGLIGAGYAILGSSVFRLAVIAWAAYLSPKNRNSHSVISTTKPIAP